jgi:Uma2 family endonuclease
MIELLERPAVRHRVAPLSVAGYHQLRDLGLVPIKSELLNGLIVEKMTKSPLHTLILHRLQERLAACLPADLLLRKEDPLTLAASEPEPHIAIVAGCMEDYRDRHPETALLVAEVAISSADLDRAKADLYARAGVRDYWLILPTSRTVEVYSDPTPEGYAASARRGSGDTLTTRYGATIDLDALFA